MPFIPGVVTELEGSGRVTFGRNGIVGTRKFRVPWVFPDNTTWLTFITQLTGVIVVDTHTGQPIRTPPDVFSNELNWLICHEAEVDGEQIAGYEGALPGNMLVDGVPVYPVVDPVYPPEKPVALRRRPISPRIQYRYAVITVKYAPKEYGERISGTGQSIQLPASTFGWTGSDTNPGSLPTTRFDEQVPVLFQSSAYTVEVRQVAFPNFRQLLRLVGKVNANATCPTDAVGNQTYVRYTPEGLVSGVDPIYNSHGELIGYPQPIDAFLGFEPRTLLLESINGNRTFLPNGSVAWDLTFNFLYNEREWVKLWRPSTAKYEFIKSIIGERMPYDPVDMSLISYYLNSY